VKSLLLFFSLPTNAMDELPCSWNLLDANMRKKIVACSDLCSQKILKRVNHELSCITTQDLVAHSPVFLTRHDHIVHLIRASQENNEHVLKNLICNADNCDHGDVLDWLPLFYTLKPVPAECLIDQTLSKGDRHWAIKAESVKDKIFARRKAYCMYADEHIPLVMSFYRGDKGVMDEYVSKASCVFKHAIINTLTPLHIAVHAHDKSMVELLVIRNPEMVNETDQSGCVPLVCAHDTEIMGMLLTCKNIAINQKYSTVIILNAIDRNDKNTVKFFLDYSTIDSIQHGVCTPLHQTAKLGHIEIVEMLLTHYPFLLDGQDRERSTALMHATQGGHLDVVELLLEYGADYTVTDIHGHKAIDYASIGGDIYELLYYYQ